MSKRKGEGRAAHFRNNAEAFDVCPELIFLMESKGLWDMVSDGVKDISKNGPGMNRTFLPVDLLIENLQALAILLEHRNA